MELGHLEFVLNITMTQGFQKFYTQGIYFLLKNCPIVKNVFCTLKVYALIVSKKIRTREAKNV